MSIKTRILVTGTPVTINTVPVVPTDLPWESLTVFESEYTAAKATADEGSTITMNLTGRYFDATGIPAPVGDNGDETRYVFPQNSSGKNNDLIINGGTFSGSIRPTWSQDGVYKKADIYDADAGPLDENLVPEGGNPEYDSRLFDPEAPLSLQPRPAVFPRAAAGFEQNPLAVNANWIVLDVDGPDSIQTDGVGDSGGINGITVVTTEFKTLVTTALGTNSLTDGSDGIIIHGQTGPNVVFTWIVTGWNETTGVMTFDSAQSYNPGYFNFAFTGRKEFATEVGDCARVLNKTNNHNELFFIPYPSTYMPSLCYPILTTPLFMYNGTDAYSTTFNDTTIQGSGKWGIRSTSSVHLKMNRCDVRWSFQGISTSGNKGQLTTIDDSYVHDVVSSGINCSDGTTITGTRVLRTEKQECVAIYVNTTGRADDEERLPLVFKHNIVSCPLSNHGSGLTMYTSSWANSEVSHNIFFNNQRHLGIQSSGPTIAYTEKSCDITNNLFIGDFIPDIVSGQKGVAENGRGDGLMWEDLENPKPNQHVNVSFNTSVGDIEMDGLGQVAGFSFPSFYYCDVNIVGNIMSALNPPVEWNTTNGLAPPPAGTNWEGGADQTNTADNYIWYNNGTTTPNGYGNSWSTQDIVSLDNMAQYNYADLTPTGDILTAATDGGKLGHRWNTTTNDLTLTAIQAKVDATSGGSDIETYWPALSTPDAQTYSPVALAISLVFP